MKYQGNATSAPKKPENESNVSLTVKDLPGTKLFVRSQRKSKMPNSSEPYLYSILSFNDSIFVQINNACNRQDENKKKDRHRARVLVQSYIILRRKVYIPCVYIPCGYEKIFFH